MAEPKASKLNRWLHKAKWFLVWIVPPWNILCWIIALEVWALRATLGLAMQEDFARRVMRAPVDLPRRILRTLRLWRRRVMGSDDQRIAECAAQQLRVTLAGKGFLVSEARVDIDGYVKVRINPELQLRRLLDEVDTSTAVAEVDESTTVEDRLELFGCIVADVYRQFPEILLDKLCSRLDPLEALDASWGAVHGMPDHARTAYTAPCYACRKNHEVGFVFGIGAVDLIYEESMKQSRLFVSQTGQRFGINGHYCDDCRKEAGLVLIIGVSTTDHEPVTPTDEKDSRPSISGRFFDA